tara:strand:+ start:639 stop:1130 length:492 start_codon:yes stop_codon:yes gene_type:complete
MSAQADQTELFDGHGLAGDYDYDRLKNGTQRVFKLLLDGRPHLADELRSVGGANWGARVRSLREERFGGMVVMAERSETSRGLWEYTLDLATVTEKAARKIFDWTVPKIRRDRMKFYRVPEPALQLLVQGMFMDVDEDDLELVIGMVSDIVGSEKALEWLDNV